MSVIALLVKKAFEVKLWRRWSCNLFLEKHVSGVNHVCYWIRLEAFFIEKICGRLKKMSFDSGRVTCLSENIESGDYVSSYFREKKGMSAWKWRVYMNSLLNMREDESRLFVWRVKTFTGFMLWRNHVSYLFWQTWSFICWFIWIKHTHEYFEAV